VAPLSDPETDCDVPLAVPGAVPICEAGDVFGEGKLGASNIAFAEL
jgi:hypothetical protein